MSSDITTMMREDAKRPPPKDRLERVRKKIIELRELEVTNLDLAERQKDNNEKIRKIKDKELVDLFDEAGIKSLGVEADGNLPAYEIELKAYYHANIPEEGAAKAFAWLKKHGHGDMIKATYTVSFGMGQEKKQKQFEVLLKKGGYEFEYKFGVPWNTLTAFVKEQIEHYKKEPPLKMLGATVGRVASLVKQKKARESTKSTNGKK
jgi:hypothetical protein